VRQSRFTVTRVTIQQPTLAKYRIPVFRELGSRPDIDLTVIHGERADLPNEAAVGFRAQEATLRSGSVGVGPLFWHTPQWSSASHQRTDVLMLTWNVRYLSLVPGLMRARAAGVPTILWGHGYSKRETPMASWTRRTITSLATALLFYNKTTANAYAEAGIPREKIFVALNCLDQSPIEKATSEWKGQANDLSQFRSNQGLSSVPLILYVSRLDPNNRIDLLIEAVARLHQQNRPVQVAIIGSGDALTKLKVLAAERRIAESVKFLGAIYDEHELASWFLSASVFCYPENIGLSILHAFGYGLPVITSDRLEQQNPEIEALRDGQNGLLYRHQDVDHLAECLWRIVADEDFKQKLSRQALATAKEDFTLKRMVDGMEAAIRYCVDPTPKPPGNEEPE
jgi:glycosyltransferase involved in cell wall biosynthesis